MTHPIHICPSCREEAESESRCDCHVICSQFRFPQPYGKFKWEGHAIAAEVLPLPLTADHHREVFSPYRAGITHLPGGYWWDVKVIRKNAEAVLMEQKRREAKKREEDYWFWYRE